MKNIHIRSEPIIILAIHHFGEKNLGYLAARLKKMFFVHLSDLISRNLSKIIEHIVATLGLYRNWLSNLKYFAQIIS